MVTSPVCSLSNSPATSGSATYISSLTYANAFIDRPALMLRRNTTHRVILNLHLYPQRTHMLRVIIVTANSSPTQPAFSRIVQLYKNTRDKR